MIASAVLLVATAAASQGEPRKEPNRAARAGANQAQRQMRQMQRQQQMKPQTRSSAPSDFSSPQPNIPRNVPNAVTNQGPRPGSWLREHQNDTPQQMEQALRSDPGFQRLPEQRQAQLLRQLQNFSSRPPQQREQMLNRMETLDSFSPDQRKQIRQVWEEFRQLPQDRRQRVHQIYQRLLCMNQPDRQTLMGSDRFRNNFSDQERGIINGALNFGVPVNGGAQPNCGAGPQSFNLLEEELFRPDLAETWAALQPAPSVVPAVYSSGTVEAAAVRNVSSGLVSGSTTTSGNGGSPAVTSGGPATGAGSGSGNGHFGMGSQRGRGGNGATGDSDVSTEELIHQTVADALEHIQVECSAGGSGGLTLGSGTRGEARLTGPGSTFEADLQRLLARTQSEPDGQALAQQIVQVLVSAIQSRQDDRSNAACVNQATQFFTAEIERILGVRHAIAAGGATEAALN